ncbi:hypothetical protein KSP40_PGU021878 [Platanthera guangdongensis]|uniref:Uncharacterized protein n=1 Tax=Platanthera guangdongensis TaxID=2320717 RepID=A0ABR2MEQ9_9ASPA
MRPTLPFHPLRRIFESRSSTFSAPGDMPSLLLTAPSSSPGEKNARGHLWTVGTQNDSWILQFDPFSLILCLFRPPYGGQKLAAEPPSGSY